MFLFSVGNIIYPNNFDNYSNPPTDSNGLNSWFYIAEGNYWSAYTGKDSNLDGIPDRPVLFVLVAVRFEERAFIFRIQLDLPTVATMFTNSSTFIPYPRLMSKKF
jgi:nitrous oxidase accessory protein NosD